MNAFQYMTPSRLPATTTERGLLVTQREILLQYILNMFLVGLIGSLPFLFRMASEPAFNRMLPMMAGIYALVVFLAVYRKLNYFIRAGLLYSLFFVAGMAYLVNNGLSGGGMLLLFLSVVLANYFFDFWAGLAAAMVSTASIAILADLMIDGRIALASESLQNSSQSPNMWMMIGGLFVLASLISLVSNRVIAQRLSVAVESQQSLANQLEKERAELESRVLERSADIRRRLTQFEVASQIARDVSAEENLNALLNNAVRLVRDRFGYYHAGIFLSDEHGDFAVLRAATGDAGKTMLERGHKLKIGETGIVGYVVKAGEPRISADVVGDEVHYKNPLLPETRSEVALPLIVGGKTIGALDVQSVTSNACSQEDVHMLQTIADQLAIAVDKARLVEQMKASLDELESIQKQATRQTWQRHLRNAHRKYIYRYHQAKLEYQAPETSQSKEAIESGTPVIKIVQTQQGDRSRPVTTLAVPIKLRGQVLGVVDIQFETSSVSPDLITLIENTVDRLAVSLENARLLEEIQSRAERERLVSEITTKVRATSEVESILRIAAQELGKSLGVSEVMVQLRNS